MKLTELIPMCSIVPRLKAETMAECLREMMGNVRRAFSAITEDECHDIVHRLLDREAMGTTALDIGVAVPHAYHSRFKHVAVTLGYSENGIVFAPGVPPVRFVFLLIVPKGRADIHMLAMSRILRAIQRPDFLTQLEQCDDHFAMSEVIEETEEKYGSASG